MLSRTTTQNILDFLFANSLTFIKVRGEVIASVLQELVMVNRSRGSFSRLVLAARSRGSACRNRLDSRLANRQQSPAAGLAAK